MDDCPIKAMRRKASRMAGFQQEWQRESRLVTLARQREQDRLRPLLERCLAELEYFKTKYSEFRPPLLTDLRAELDRKKEK